jgi:hypothetical protein
MDIKCNDKVKYKNESYVVTDVMVEAEKCNIYNSDLGTICVDAEEVKKAE